MTWPPSPCLHAGSNQHYKGQQKSLNKGTVASQDSGLIPKPHGLGTRYESSTLINPKLATAHGWFDWGHKMHQLQWVIIPCYKFCHLHLSIRPFSEWVVHKFWPLLGYTVVKVYTSPRNLTCSPDYSYSLSNCCCNGETVSQWATTTPILTGSRCYEYH